MFLIPNAANTAPRWPGCCTAAAPAGIAVTDQHETYAILAVQGTHSDEVLAAIGLPAGTATCPSSRPTSAGCR